MHDQLAKLIVGNCISETLSRPNKRLTLASTRELWLMTKKKDPTGFGLATGGSTGLIIGAILGGPVGAAVLGIFGAILGQIAEEKKLREESEKKKTSD